MSLLPPAPPAPPPPLNVIGLGVGPNQMALIALLIKAWLQKLGLLPPDPVPDMPPEFTSTAAIRAWYQTRLPPDAYGALSIWLDKVDAGTAGIVAT